jgi:predicted nucleotidyltransferase
MKSLSDIKSTLEKHKYQLFNNYPIKSLAIFGSYSRNGQDENSDLDILVEFNDKIGIRFIDLADEIENLVGTKVDLVSRNGIKDKYYRAINSELIYV